MFAEVEMHEPAAWLPKLRDVVFLMQSPEIMTAEALCVKLAGDVVAGVVLHELLTLLPRSIRDDGAIWKSDAYWVSHKGISYWHMRKVRKALAGLVTTWKTNAQGAPTFHYKIDTEGMCKALAGIFGRTVAYMRGLLFEAAGLENRNEGTLKSITIDSDSDSFNLNQESESKSLTVTEILKAEGVNETQAAEFAEMPLPEVQKVVDAAVAKDAAGELRRSKAAYIVTSLKNNAAQVAKQASEKGVPDGWAYVPPVEGEVRPISQPSPLPEGEGDETAEGRMFQVAMGQLEAQLGAIFHTWLRGAVLKAAQAGAFVIGVRNEICLEACEGRLARSIQRIFQDVVGSPVVLRFEVA